MDKVINSLRLACLREWRQCGAVLICVLLFFPLALGTIGYIVFGVVYDVLPKRLDESWVFTFGALIALALPPITVPVFFHYADKRTRARLIEQDGFEAVPGSSPFLKHLRDRWSERRPLRYHIESVLHRSEHPTATLIRYTTSLGNARERGASAASASTHHQIRVEIGDEVDPTSLQRLDPDNAGVPEAIHLSQSTDKRHLNRQLRDSQSARTAAWLDVARRDEATARLIEEYRNLIEHAYIEGDAVVLETSGTTRMPYVVRLLRIGEGLSQALIDTTERAHP